MTQSDSTVELAAQARQKDPKAYALGVPPSHILAGTVERVAEHGIGLTPQVHDALIKIFDNADGYAQTNAIVSLEQIREAGGSDMNPATWQKALQNVDTAIRSARKNITAKINHIAGLPEMVDLFVGECKEFANKLDMDTTAEFVRYYDPAWRDRPEVEKWIAKDSADPDVNTKSVPIKVTQSRCFSDGPLSCYDKVAPKLMNEETREKLATEFEKLAKLSEVAKTAADEFDQLKVRDARFRGF